MLPDLPIYHSSWATYLDLNIGKLKISDLRVRNNKNEKHKLQHDQNSSKIQLENRKNI
jgi:hypothetical protein